MLELRVVKTLFFRCARWLPVYFGGLHFFVMRKANKPAFTYFSLILFSRAIIVFQKNWGQAIRIP
jgi:hypothetical protein